MIKEYPLFPELTEEGAKQATDVINRVTEGAVKLIRDSIMDEFYGDLPCYIESDAWTNFRNNMVAGFCDYSNRLKQGEWDFKKLRQKILAEHRDELIADLNQDLVKENEELKTEIRLLNECRDPFRG